MDWGIGIIVTAIAILPQLRVGGMQLFELESSDMSGKFLPRITDIAAYLGFTYLLISMLCALLYYLTGMDWFDAITHAMTTMSAGGIRRMTPRSAISVTPMRRMSPRSSCSLRACHSACWRC